MEKTDVIVVLSHAVDSKGESTPTQKERVKKTVELYKKDRVPKIILTGGFDGRFGRSSIPTAKAMADDAIAFGIPEKDIILEKRACFTIENARFSKEIVDKEGWKNIIVVTSGSHLPRTKLIFKRIFGKRYKLSFIGAKDPLPFWQLLRKYFGEFKRMPRDIKATRKIRGKK